MCRAAKDPAGSSAASAGRGSGARSAITTTLPAEEEAARSPTPPARVTASGRHHRSHPDVREGCSLLHRGAAAAARRELVVRGEQRTAVDALGGQLGQLAGERSEERRVGKEGRSRRSPYHSKK